MIGKTYTILIVEDEIVNLTILKNALDADYNILTARNGKEALDILEDENNNVSAIILDIIMPIMNGFEFLEVYRKYTKFRKIPLLVSSVENDSVNEERCLALGASDFISKPYNISIIKMRLKNAIDRSQIELIEKLSFALERDSLTGIYNKNKMFWEMDNLIKNSEKQFVFISYDLDDFKIFNSFFGVDQGDLLIKAMAQNLKQTMKEFDFVLFARNANDKFNIVVENNKKIIFRIINNCVKFLSEFKIGYRIKPSFGIYVIEDKFEDYTIMNDKAIIAAKKCKGKFDSYYNYYDKKIIEDMESAQILINRIDKAIENEEFQVYYQPKFNIRDNKVVAAEALCRWIDPKYGMVSPAKFIPVFEQNGLIAKLDYYMWENVCKHIRHWIDLGIEVCPISVNVSRVNLYNQRLVEILCELIEKYDIPKSLLALELTETAYTEDPELSKKVLTSLKENGFYILMDDFGSGYSSLNTLKDIPVDELKVDMRFMSDSENGGRSASIVATIVKMAKWLKMAVVVEGVEKENQVNFLRGLGCDYVQGFYFAKPMPKDEYEKLISGKEVDQRFFEKQNDLYAKIIDKKGIYINDILYNYNIAGAIVTSNGSDTMLVSANYAFFSIFGYRDVKNQVIDYEKISHKNIIPKEQDRLKSIFKRTILTKGRSKFEYAQTNINDENLWLSIEMAYICKIDEVDVVLISFENITSQKQVENLIIENRDMNILLIGCDDRLERDIDVNFGKDYKCFCLESYQDVFEKIEEKNFNFDLIIADAMYNEDKCIEFLEKRSRNVKIESIPVIISFDMDRRYLLDKTDEYKISDYITVPFSRKIVINRIERVLNSQKYIKNFD